MLNKNKTLPANHSPLTTTISTAIVGANGYTGVELIRLLLAHPNVELTTITSRQYAKQRLDSVFPSFAGKTDLTFSHLNVFQIAKHNQIVFLCLPHHESMEIAAKFRSYGTKVIDLSADFRFENVKKYEKTYGKHTQKKLAKQAVYGLCEIFGEDVKKTFLTAVPGCYVTSIILALAPLLQNQMIVTKNIICDSKSGTSGAGRSAKINQLLAEQYGNFKAYSITGHRHRPEIEEKLTLLAGSEIKITFTPHLLPVSRGILSTIYVEPIRKWTNAKLRKTYKSFYKSSPFIKLLKEDQAPQIKSVVGTNDCQISLHYDDHSEKLIILSAIDNLTKGASGQAVQCMNLMCGFEETMGLTDIALWP